MQQLQGHTDSIRTLQFSPDGMLLASGSDDKTVRVWNGSHTPVWKPLVTLPHASLVRVVGWSPDSQILAVGCVDKVRRCCCAAACWCCSVWWWWTGLQPRQTQRVVPSLSLPADGVRTLHAPSWLSDHVLPTAAFACTCTPIAPTPPACHPPALLSRTWCTLQSVKLWTPKTWSSGNPMLSFQAHGSQVTCLAFSVDGALLVTGSGDSSTKVWELSTGTNTSAFMGEASVYGVCFTDAGSKVVTYNAQKASTSWEVRR